MHRDLRVPGLPGPSLRFAAGQAATGADAIVLGFPLDGPYDEEEPASAIDPSARQGAIEWSAAEALHTEVDLGRDRVDPLDQLS